MKKNVLITLAIMLTVFQVFSQKDDTKLFQDVINKGGNISIQKDSIYVTDISIPGNTNLSGINMPYIKAHSIRFENASNSSISGFEIEGYTSGGTTLIQVQSCNWIKVKDNILRDNQAEGVAINHSKNCEVTGNSIYRMDVGVMTNGGNEHITIAKNYIVDGSSDGIAIFGMAFRSAKQVYNVPLLKSDNIDYDKTIVVENNEVIGKKANGIVLRCTSGVLVRGNTLSRNNFGVGCMQNVSFVKVSGNKLNANLRNITGLCSYSSIDNNVIDSGSYGIWIGAENDFDTTFSTTVIGNIVKNCETDVLLTVMKGGIIQDNVGYDDRPVQLLYGVMRQPTYSGLTVRKGFGNIVTGNTMSSAYIPIHVNQATNTTLFLNFGSVLDQGVNTTQIDKKIDDIIKRLAALEKSSTK